MFGNSTFIRFSVISTRIFLGILFFTAGMGKLIQGFPGLMGPPWLEQVLAKYDLGLFAQFIAYAQVFIGLLLLTRFALLGAIMLLPMLLNILAVTISQNWTGTPYVVSVFLLMNLFLLLHDFPKLKFLLSDDSAPAPQLPIIRKNPRIDACCILGAIILFAGLPFAKIYPLVSWGTFWVSAAVFAGCGVWQVWVSRNFKTIRTGFKSEH